MISDSGCCGTFLKNDNVTILGLVTFSLPVTILCTAITPAFFILGKMNRHIEKIRKKTAIIMRANLRLIHNVSLMPKVRCALAGKVFSCSAKISGFFYRYFNLSVLILLWLGVVFCFYLIKILMER